MATVELVGTHADGDYLHGAELDSIRRAANGCGVLASSISATVTQTDLNITLPAFNYVAPDGSGGRKVVSYAGGTVARSAADATNPANDLLVGDADGNVTLRDGTPTAETGDVEDAPMVTLASDEVVIAKVRRPENSTAVLTTHISPRAVDVSDAWPSKGSDIASASALNLPEAGTYFDVTGTTAITSIESRPAGFEVTLQFDAQVKVTHNASSLILAGGADYYTTAGDVIVFVSEGSGNWREVSRSRDGAAIAGPLVPGTDGPYGYSTQAFSSNTTARVSRIHLDRPKLVSTVSFNATAVGASGTIAFAIFSEDGQTRYINDATGTISGTGIVTKDVTDTWLPAGVYYLMAVSQSSANVTFNSYIPLFLVAAPSGARELSGTVTVTAGTIPDTFDPDADVTFSMPGAPVVRFD